MNSLKILCITPAWKELVPSSSKVLDFLLQKTHKPLPCQIPKQCCFSSEPFSTPFLIVPVQHLSLPIWGIIRHSSPLCFAPFSWLAVIYSWPHILWQLTCKFLLLCYESSHVCSAFCSLSQMPSSVLSHSWVFCLVSVGALVCFSFWFFGFLKFLVPYPCFCLVLFLCCFCAAEK